MAKPKIKIYVGCSLTGAPEEFKANVEKFKHTLKTKGYEVFDFLGLVAGTPLDVYKWDIGHCVGDCDLFIGICDLPSIGLGFEMSQALNLGKPILAVAHQEAKVTRLVLGAAEAEQHIHFIRYQSLEADILPAVEKLTTTTSPQE